MWCVCVVCVCVCGLFSKRCLSFAKIAFWGASLSVSTQTPHAKTCVYSSRKAFLERGSTKRDARKRAVSPTYETTEPCSLIRFFALASDQRQCPSPLSLPLSSPYLSPSPAPFLSSSLSSSSSSSPPYPTPSPPKAANKSPSPPK